MADLHNLLETFGRACQKRCRLRSGERSGRLGNRLTLTLERMCDPRDHTYATAHQPQAQICKEKVVEILEPTSSLRQRDCHISREVQVPADLD